MTAAWKGPLPWILPLAVALVAFGISRLNTAEIIERRLLDARFKMRGPRPIAETPFQIVAVDDQTFSSLNTKWPFGGSHYARFVRNLNRAGARLIVFDIEFTEPNTLHPQEDSLFAAAIEEAGNVILAGKIGYIFHTRFEESYAFPVPPIPVLSETEALWGIVNEITDADDFTRRYLLYLPFGNKLKLSLGLETLRAMQGMGAATGVQLQDRICRFGDLEIPLYDQQSFLINYYGPAGTFPAISFSSVLDDSSFDLAPGFDSDYMERFMSGARLAQSSGLSNPFEGKVILVGASAEELHDTKNTPFYDFESTPRKTPGVEVHANALQTILDGSFIHRTPLWIVLICNLVLAYVIFLLVGALKLLRGLILSLLVIIAALAAAMVLFSRHNLWVDLVSPLIAIGLAYLGVSLYHYFLERREKARIREMFSHYVPDKVVSEIIRNPDLLKLGGERRRLTILFADIAGFTSISEGLTPEELVILLNEFMTAMTEIILTCDGIIDKYEGDLIMAEFGAPVPFPDHALLACRAALLMQQALQGLREKWESEEKPPLRIRIGINTGDVIVGNMGSRDVFDYTVLGDAVNLCSRLEEANKIYKTEVMISQSTRDEIPDNFVTRILGDLRVRGRSEPVRVYELVTENENSLTTQQRKLLSVYQKGWLQFEARKWAEAAGCFDQALGLDPDDHPSRLYLRYSQKFGQNPPEPDWDGILTFSD